MAKSKLKTKSAIKKRFKLRGSSIVSLKSGKRHGMRKRPTKLNNQKTGYFAISPRDENLILRSAGYGLKK